MYIDIKQAFSVVSKYYIKMGFDTKLKGAFTDLQFAQKAITWRQIQALRNKVQFIQHKYPGLKVIEIHWPRCIA